MDENKWIYNTDKEVWMNCGVYDTKEEAINAGKEDYKGVRSQFFVGQISNMNLTPGVNVDQIIEDIAENVYSEVGEAAECYLDDVQKKELSELEDMLNAVLHKWMDKHDCMPKYFRVKNIETIALG